MRKFYLVPLKEGEPIKKGIKYHDKVSKLSGKIHADNFLVIRRESDGFTDYEGGINCDKILAHSTYAANIKQSSVTNARLYRKFRNQFKKYRRNYD